ncbi:inovirus-type Gp2 protein [Saccharospirillum alexandrii]|uniref:YagK/YfjJ domain-containing protein n=1 Tax=Saccharospirillum alexandrii TaxID=2448477 RepID=UPI0037353F2C
MLGIQANLKHLTEYQSDRYKGLPVQCSPSQPEYKEILDCSYRELTRILARYSRVILIRFDLAPGNTASSLSPPKHHTSISMSPFLTSVRRKLERKYQTKMAYVWVKEYGNDDYNTGAHWHLWVALKKHNDHKPPRLAEAVKKLILSSWEQQAGINDRNRSSSYFYLDRTRMSPEVRAQDQESIRIDDLSVLIKREALQNRVANKNMVLGGVIDEAFYAISYLAKAYTKLRVESGKGERTYNCSNIGLKDINKQGRDAQISENLANIEEWLDVPLEPVDML